MRSPRQFAALVTAMAAFGLLFVVVCPITATPNAVVSGHAPLVLNGLAALAAFTLLFCAPPLAASRIFRPLFEVRHPLPAHDRLIDLTCARLC